MEGDPAHTMALEKIMVNSDPDHKRQNTNQKHPEPFVIIQIERIILNHEPYGDNNHDGGKK